MKKLWLLLVIILTTCLWWPRQTVQAKAWLLDTSQTDYLTLDNGLTVKFIDWEKSKEKWCLELQPQADGSQKLGVYPSNKKVSYQLQVISGPMLNYQIADQAAAGWQDLTRPITSHKILLQSSDQTVAEAAEELEVTDMANVSADNIVRVYSDQPVIIAKVMGPVANGLFKLSSAIYKISAAAGDQVAFSYKQSDNFSKKIYQFNEETLQWESLDSYNDFPNKKITAVLKDTESRIAVFSDLSAHDGIASFYDQSRYRYFDYQNGNFAASRDYPKGTKLKITRLKSNDSVIVEVNDYGPELSTGRLVDLDISAFKKIGSIRAGLIYVKVEPYDQNS